MQSGSAHTHSSPFQHTTLNLTLFFGLLLCTLLPSSVTGQKIHFGTGSSWDYGVRLGGTEDFPALGNGKTSLVSFDVYAGLSLGRLNVYPTFIFSLPYRTNLVSNPQGDYIPEGFEVVLPYNENGPSLYFSDDYYTLTSDAEVWQKSIGAFFTLTLIEGFEIGSGLFVRNKRTDIYSYEAYDEYYYYGSSGTDTDHYAWYNTYEYWGPTEVRSYRETIITAPITAKFNYDWDWLHNGMQVIYYTGKDNYWSFRYTLGVVF